MRLVALLGSGLLLACAAVPTAPHVHEPSGLVIPARVGEFVRTSVFDSAPDLGAGAQTVHYESRGFSIARISITVRPPSSAGGGDARSELAFSAGRFVRGLTLGPPQPDAFRFLGVTRPAMRARLELGKGSFPDHVEVVALPWERFVIEGRLYSRDEHDAQLAAAFRRILEAITLTPAAPTPP